MAELTLPFWLASARLDDSASVQDWLKSIHVQPRWLDELLIISAQSESHLTAPSGVNNTLITHKWVNWQGSQHQILHEACRKIITGDRQMILLAAELDKGTTVVLLCSPSIVGMYNLVPLAYVDTRLEIHLATVDSDILGQIQSKLLTADRTAEHLNALLLEPGPFKKPVKNNTPFAGAVWVKTERESDPSALSACHELVTYLGETNKKQGLAVEVDDDQNLAGTWIERI